MISLRAAFRKYLITIMMKKAELAFWPAVYLYDKFAASMQAVDGHLQYC